MNELVEPKSSELIVFDKVAAIIADYKDQNEELASGFDYESKEGIKEVKSHISKLRKVKTKVSEIHKEAKAEALAFGRRLDAKKNEYNGEVDKMIDFHEKPLEAIKKKETEEALARAQEFEDAEAERISGIAAREQAVKLREEKIAREKAEAEEKIAWEKAKEAERTIKEQQEKIAKIEEERRIAEEKVKTIAMLAESKELAEAEAEEERLADIAAEKAIEANRIADKNHRIKIENEIRTVLANLELLPDFAYDFVEALKEGRIPHVSIIY